MAVVRNMSKSCVSILFVVVLLFGAPVRAQEAAPAPVAPGGVKETPLVHTFTLIAGSFQQPLHPVLESAPPGLAAGIGYTFPSTGRWQTSTKAATNVERYWVAEVATGYHSTRAGFDTYARMRDMPQLEFFGGGINSSRDNLTHFRLRDPIVGTLASVRLHSSVSIGGRAEALWPKVERSRPARLPTLEDRFTEVDAPGLSEQPRFGRYQVFVDITAPAGLGPTLNQGGRYRVSYSMFDDQQFDRFSFRRLDVEARHRFELFGRYRRLTLHGWASTSYNSIGNDVPFFFQPTLGGIGPLGSVDEDLIGSDGSTGTLRGFGNFRFRDRNLLLLQAEYRWPLWGPFDVTAFVDAGKVTNRRQELDLSHLKHNYGFSISVMRGTGTLVRMDLGFGGGEGRQLFFTLDREFFGSRPER
jgi:hypothetical protein